MAKPHFGTISYRAILFFFIVSCSGLERSETAKVRRQNCKAERITRFPDRYLYPISPPAHTPRHAYPWESEVNLPRITKEFFRCKGTPLNPPILQADAEPVLDCDSNQHGLPIIHGKETVYPILIDLLNFIQKRTGRRVVITCGHRCPAHNSYSDSGKENRTSKHQIGAEVDFYVQGMEDRPLEIVGLLMQYYQEMSVYAGRKEYLEFRRYDKPDARVVTQPWYNQEIYIKLYQKEEGRDADNRHPYPYLSLQVRYDRHRSERVLYSWDKAYKSYPRSYTSRDSR